MATSQYIRPSSQSTPDENIKPEEALATTRRILSELGIAPEQAGLLRDVPARDLVSAHNAVARKTIICAACIAISPDNGAMYVASP